MKAGNNRQHACAGLPFYQFYLNFTIIIDNIVRYVK